MLQSVELMDFENNKKNNILLSKYSKDSNPPFIRNYKSYKIDSIINLKKNFYYIQN